MHVSLYIILLVASCAFVATCIFQTKLPSRFEAPLPRLQRIRSRNAFLAALQPVALITVVSATMTLGALYIVLQTQPDSVMACLDLLERLRYAADVLGQVASGWYLACAVIAALSLVGQATWRSKRQMEETTAAIVDARIQLHDQLYSRTHPNVNMALSELMARETALLKARAQLKDVTDDVAQYDNRFAPTYLKGRLEVNQDVCATETTKRDYAYRNAVELLREYEPDTMARIDALPEPPVLSMGHAFARVLWSRLLFRYLTRTSRVFAAGMLVVYIPAHTIFFVPGTEATLRGSMVKVQDLALAMHREHSTRLPSPDEVALPDALSTSIAQIIQDRFVSTFFTNAKGPQMVGRMAMELLKTQPHQLRDETTRSTYLTTRDRITKLVLHSTEPPFEASGVAEDALTRVVRASVAADRSNNPQRWAAIAAKAESLRDLHAAEQRDSIAAHVAHSLLSSFLSAYFVPLPPNAVEPEERALIRAVLAQSLDDSFDVLAAEEPADRSWERLHQPAKTSGETSWLMTQPALQRVLTEASSHIAALAGRPTDQRPDARPRVVLTFDLLREKYSSVLSRERQHTTTKGVIDESASKSSVVEIERPGIFERLLKDGPAVSDHGQRVPSIHHSYPPSITTRQGGRRKGIWIGSARDATSIQTPSGLSWRDAPDQQVEVLLLSASKAPKLYRLHQADIGPALALAAEVADTPRGESVRVVDISPYDERQDWTVNLHPTVVGHDIAAFLVRIDLAIARALIGGFPMETEGGYRHLASIAHLNYRLGSGAALGAFSSSNDLYEFVVNELWGQSAYRSVAARAILDRLSNPKGQDLSGLDRCLDLHKLSSFEKCLAAYDGPARKRISFKLNAGLAYSHTPATDATCGTSSALKKVSVDIHLEAQEDGRPRVAELTDSRSIEIPELERAAKETRARICRRLRGDANTRSDVERVDSFASLSRDLGVAVLHNPDIAVRAVALLANAPPFKADGLVPAAAREADYIVHRPATFSHELLRNVKAMSAHIRPLLSGQADPATRVAATRVSQTLHKCTRYLQERIPKGLDLTPSALEASPCLTPDRVFRNRDVKELASNDEVAADIARIARLGITIDRREAIRREVRPVSALIGNR